MKTLNKNLRLPTKTKGQMHENLLLEILSI